MKNINVKKVVAGAAALGVASMFAGAVVAANVGSGVFTPVTKSDIFNTSGVPAVNVIIGAEAKPVDVVWAGNIAGAIGHKAYTAVEGSGTATFNNVVVEVGSTSTSTTVAEGSGLLEDDRAITQTATAFDGSLDLTKNDYTKLHDEDVTGNITGDNSYSLKETETLTVDGDTLFSDDSDVEDFMALIAQDDINYTASFEGSGIPHNVDVGDYWASGDDLDIWFMGSQYSIQSISSDGSKLTLVGTGSSQSYQTGDEVAVTDTNGTAYKLQVGNAYNSGSKILLKLLDSTGAVLKSEQFEANDDVEFTGYPLAESISVVSISDDDSTANLDLCELSVGSGSTLELEDTKVLPGYGTSSNKLWKVSIGGDVNYIKSISVTNSAQVWDTQDKTDDDAGLVIGDSITLPLTMGNVVFQGLTTETDYSFSIDGGNVIWDDDSGNSHEAQLYEDNVKNDTVSIDGEDYYFEYSTDDSGTVAIKEDDSDGTTVGTITGVDLDWVSTQAYITGSDNLAMEYMMKYEPSKLHLSLDSNTYDLGKSTSASWSFVGTADELNLSNVEDITSGTTNFYSSDEDDAKATAIFKITDGADENTYIFIDPYTKKLPIKDDYATNSENYYAEVWYDLNADKNTSDSDPADWTLDEDNEENDMAMGYTNYGAKFEVDGQLPTVSMPQDALKLKMFVGSGGTSDSVIISNGKEFTLTTEGTVMSDETTGLSAKLISKSVSGGTTGSYMTPAAWNVSNDQLVYLDSDNPSGAKIIVGGYMVNTLAQNIGLENLITTDGTWVSGKSATGDIVVAGYTATDTANAAKELIVAIENM